MSLRRSQSESRMPEIGTSGLMSGDGKRGGAHVSTRAHPRLYLSFAGSYGKTASKGPAGHPNCSVNMRFRVRATSSCPAAASA